MVVRSPGYWRNVDVNRLLGDPIENSVLSGCGLFLKQKVYVGSADMSLLSLPYLG
jgi:hypothetical protein